MEQFLPSFLFFLFTCLPPLFFRPLNRKRFAPCLFLCLLASAAEPDFPCLLFLFALGLGLFLFFAVRHSPSCATMPAFSLCWGGCLAVLDVGHLLFSILSSALTTWVLLLLTFLIALAFALASRWFSRWTLEDAIQLSEEQSITPATPLVILLFLLLFCSLFGGYFPLICACIAVFLHILLLLLLSLWNNMTLTIRHSRESSENSRQSVQAIDRASRSTEAELRRRLTESDNKLHQVKLAFQNGDRDTLASLLELSQEAEESSYSSFLLLDAILRHRAAEARKAGLQPNFQLRLGTMNGFSLAEIGVLLDLMLTLMGEPHPGNQDDALRLRMQEWGDALVIVVGRRDALRTLPEDKMNVLRQLTGDRLGWLELTEKEKGICLSAVLFRNDDEADPTLPRLKEESQ